MEKLCKYLLLSSAVLLASACSSFSDGENDTEDSPEYSLPYLA